MTTEIHPQVLVHAGQSWNLFSLRSRTGSDCARGIWAVFPSTGSQRRFWNERFASYRATLPGTVSLRCYSHDGCIRLLLSNGDFESHVLAALYENRWHRAMYDFRSHSRLPRARAHGMLRQQKVLEDGTSCSVQGPLAQLEGRRLDGCSAKPVAPARRWVD